MCPTWLESPTVNTEPVSNTSTTLEWAGVVAASGGVGSVLTKIFSRRKDNADAAAAIAQAAVALVAPLEKRVSVLETDNALMKAEHARTASKLRLALDHIRTLYAWISAHALSFERTPPQPPEELGL